MLFVIVCGVASFCISSFVTMKFLDRRRNGRVPSIQLEQLFGIMNSLSIELRQMRNETMDLVRIYKCRESELIDGLERLRIEVRHATLEARRKF